MLPSYYQHVCRYENSLVTKFFGVHCVKPIGGQKVFVGKCLLSTVFHSHKFIQMSHQILCLEPDSVHCDGQSVLLGI